MRLELPEQYKTHCPFCRQLLNQSLYDRYERYCNHTVNVGTHIRYEYAVIIEAEMANNEFVINQIVVHNSFMDQITRLCDVNNNIPHSYIAMMPIVDFNYDDPESIKNKVRLLTTFS